MTDISDAALAKAVAKAKELAPHMPGKVDTMRCDVSKESDVQAIVEHLDSWGGVDVMFNNAGIMHGDDDGRSTAPFLSLSLSTHAQLTPPQTPSPPPRKSGT